MATTAEKITMVLIFVLVFSTFITLIPASFMPAGVDSQDEIVIDTLRAADLIVYSNQGQDSMTYSYSSLTDAPDPPQYNASFPDGEYLEVWWGTEGIYGVHYIELRHVHTVWYGGYGQVDKFTIYYLNGTQASDLAGIGTLSEESIVAAWDSETNSSRFTARCAHASVSILFQPDDGYDDIATSYEDDHLFYMLSYQWDPDATGFNILSILANILTFQGLNIGVPGTFGDFLNALIGTVFWIIIAVVAYEVITAVIPFIPGFKDK